MTSPLHRKVPTTAPAPATQETKPFSAVSTSEVCGPGACRNPAAIGNLSNALGACAVLIITALVAASANAQDAPRRFPRGLLAPPLGAPFRTREATMHFSRAPVEQREAASPANFMQSTEREHYGRPRKDIDEVEPPSYGEMPGADRLFRRESEEDWRDRVREDEKRRLGADRVEFPPEPRVSKEMWTPRFFPPATAIADACFVPHGRLLYVQPNFERLGYDFGIFQPAISTGIFYFDCLTAPYQYCKRPFQQFDASAGKPLPGDDAPFVIEPIEPSFTGLLGEAFLVTGIVFAFP